MKRLVPRRLLIWLGSISTAATAALSPEQTRTLPPAADHSINFTKEIKPILEARCANCHGFGRDKGKFRMDSRETFVKGGSSGAALVLGQSAESYLIELVMGFEPDNVMPKKGTKLSQEQISLLRAWIDQGAKWDAEISFARAEPLNLKPRRPELPEVSIGNDHPIDRMLAVYFKEHQVTPGDLVNDRVFARRAYLDIIGLLPPPDALRRFLADRNRNKRRILVRQLLADSENYALHWLSFWNDLLRNDYKGTGYIDGGRKQITQWLYSSLETNKPYNQFVAELVNPTPECEGFTKGIVWRGVVNSSQRPPLQAAQSISQVFMGVNLKCASCHDSFINSWMLSDAYGLASIYADEPLELVECDKPTGRTAPPRFIYPQLGELKPSAEKEVRLGHLAELITRREDGRLPRTLVNRLWQKFFGHGLVEPLDDMEKPAWNADLLDWLAEDFADHGYDVKHLIETMLTSHAYQLPAVTATEAEAATYVFHGPNVRRLSAEQFRDAIGEVTGAWYEKPVAKVILADGSTNQFVATRAALVTADPLQVALGRPNREQVLTSRSLTATTLQALELTNGSDLAELLKQGAESLSARKHSNRARLVTELYEKALGRTPTVREGRMARELLGRPVQPAGLEDLMWSLTMLPEFQLVY